MASTSPQGKKEYHSWVKDGNRSVVDCFVAFPNEIESKQTVSMR